ncbi:IS110 family transposase [Egibacter rhizosphaerae]|uniref:IS110 family transposase n=1 Tax=Egibacter rhizosphaerae TaxID=1670831 RepID=A0A411YLF7_9ACTN|nr:IS110 family transposase [Egibacter rhizosphaerae]QBI21907.1 IS110 family transposase [Egibacter rhizosphaerae]QBI21915.1 IS110 family transposase [Egibacter rhizosphaerae]QBI22035.1 IS110 family transposase [Egibacter rhizosphaerae]QBI22158.1 IS110 family transposase [Egibacter rhizosphaerae]
MGLDRLVAVPVDVGKSAAMAMVVDFSGRRLAAPFEFALDRSGVAGFVARVERVLPAETALVRVGVEACGHYHRPLVASRVLPGHWQLVEHNPAWVSAQRRVNGTGRTKTDPIDLTAIADLLLAGRGYEVAVGDELLVELSAWAAHRRRRVQARSAVKNQLTGQLDRCFPGLGASLSSVLGTKVGRLVAAEFSDPDRLARLGVARFRAFAARRDVRVSVALAERLVAAARDALPTPDAAVARQVLAADLALLDGLDGQLAEVDARIDALVPATRYRVLTSGPGWGAVRAAGYAAGVGDPARWPSHRQVYRAAGLNPAQYESAGRRRDSGISREGSVPLRRAILDLGVGLWHQDPAARRYAAGLRERGKPGAIIATALARRANKIAFAMVRDQTLYDPACWASKE